MAEIIKIVLTGGHCGGKSSALSFLKDKLETLGLSVLILEETATKLLSQGKTPETMGNYDFHKLLFETQLNGEKELELIAEKNTNKSVIICDRGLLDSRAYVTEDEFKKYSALYNLNEELIRSSYDAVFHLMSTAVDAKGYYTLKNNTIRSESIEKAAVFDDEILSLWVGTPHLRVICNYDNFQNKLDSLFNEVCGFVGVPEPLEIERKFLIEYPDLSIIKSLKMSRKSPITQAYLSTTEEGNFRVRKRGVGENAVYIKTVKIKINDLKRIEKENYISEAEYNKYLSDKKNIVGIISKDRYCIIENNTYYELDIYPFWNDKATLEIELLSETQSYVLPSFVKLIREVSEEPEYRNFALAQKYNFMQK